MVSFQPPTPPPLPSPDDAAKAGQQLVDAVVNAAENAANEAGDAAAHGAEAAQPAAEAALEVVLMLAQAALARGAQARQIALMAMSLNLLAGVTAISESDAVRQAALVMNFGLRVGTIARAVAEYSARRELAKMCGVVNGLRTDMGRLDMQLKALLNEIEKLRANEARAKNDVDRSNERRQQVTAIIGNLAQAVRILSDTVSSIGGMQEPKDAPSSEGSAAQAADAAKRLQVVLERLLPRVQRQFIGRPNSGKAVGRMLELRAHMRVLGDRVVKASDAARFAQRLQRADLNPAARLPPSRR